MAIKIRSAYDCDNSSHHHPDPTPEMEEFATKQEFKKECDINHVWGQYQKGIMPPPWMTSKTPFYDEGFCDRQHMSFQEAFQLTQDAQEAFMGLPIEARKELDHDPRNLDRVDREFFARHGLLKRPEASQTGDLPGESSPTFPPSKAAVKPPQAAKTPGKQKGGVNPPAPTSDEE